MRYGKVLLLLVEAFTVTGLAANVVGTMMQSPESASLAAIVKASLTTKTLLSMLAIVYVPTPEAQLLPEA